MQPTAHRLPVQRTAHFYTLGEPSANVKRMWFACHGYGQLASTFIRKFDQLAGAEDYVVAPEGLSRFYWQGFTGKVVASWMTSADRL
ncbi:MAG: phospholipase, partial [Bacteroidota bacterium]